MFCNMCGNELAEGAAFCQKCGAKVLNEENVQDQNEDFEYWDRKELWKGIFDDIKEEIKDYIDSFMAMPTDKKVFWALVIGISVIFCVLIIAVLLKVFFSNVILLIIFVVGGYIAYQKWGAKWVTSFIYWGSSKRLFIPDGMTVEALVRNLNGKFDYPYFKGARYAADDQCMIEGRYSVYYVIFYDNKTVELKCCEDEDNKMYRTILLEAIAIRSYINRFFNPALKIDADKDLQALKSAEGQRKVVAFVLSAATFLIILAISLEYAIPGGMQRMFRPGMEVRDAYLSQYSKNVTVEEAFDNFFENGKWSKYESEGYSFVVFTGSCEYLGERADVRVTFKITGENFVVDSLDINGRTQNDLILFALLESVYNEEE